MPFNRTISITQQLEFGEPTDQPPTLHNEGGIYAPLFKEADTEYPKWVVLQNLTPSDRSKVRNAVHKRMDKYEQCTRGSTLYIHRRNPESPRNTMGPQNLR